LGLHKLSDGDSEAQSASDEGPGPGDGNDPTVIVIRHLPDFMREAMVTRLLGLEYLLPPNGLSVVDGVATARF
jgi:hypothetical protein